MNPFAQISKWRYVTSCATGVAVFVGLSAPATADVVVDWNKKAYEVLPSVGITNGPRQSTVVANMHIAQHDALNAIEPQFERYAYAGEWRGASKGGRS